MTTTTPGPTAPHAGAHLCPLSLTIDPLAAMLNFELSDHDVYDGGELQWFDDEVHGTGMLAFLSRRSDRRVDYYAQRGLSLDRRGYEIGGGTRSWNVIDFDVARLQVFPDGVVAAVRFADVEDRQIDIRIDDRNGRRRRRAALLAPVGAAIEKPASLMLVWMPVFDLVRDTGSKPVIRIDGEEVAIGRLPGARLHRRHLIKYAGDLVAVAINPDHDGPLSAATLGMRITEPSRVAAVTAEGGSHNAGLVLNPGLPDLADLLDGSVEDGRWYVTVDASRITGGTWTVARTGDQVDVALDVDERWKPRRLPWLMRVVTTVLPVFRRWPTTYRWRGVVQLGPPPTMTSRWQRTDSAMAEGYRRATS